LGREVERILAAAGEPGTCSVIACYCGKGLRCPASPHQDLPITTRAFFQRGKTAWPPPFLGWS
jgi:hypothetical protein